MDRKQIESEHIVARYLADQLSPEEAAEFEAYYVEHPSMVREIERTLRLKEGLATLQDRGQLEALMRARRGWAIPLSVAAALAVAVVGGWAWLRAPDTGPVASSLEELVAESKSPLPLAGKYLLVRVRGGEAALEIPFPAQRSALELQMLPSAGTAGAPYRVALERVESEGRADRVGEANALRPGADGLVTAVLDSARLQPGRYAVELAPEQADGTVPADRFIIDLR
jgi:hypothetical protein